MRVISAWVSIPQSRQLLVPTGKGIRAYCKKARLACRSVDVQSSGDEPPATLHYIPIANKHRSRVLFYLHGGAYVSPMNVRGQLPFALDCAKAAEASELICLEYDLAPELKYPGQLAQTVAGLEHILKDHDPSQVILVGDSAGGHLILSLLAHIKKPNPQVKPLRPLDQDFLGSLLVSPWVSMRYDSASFKAFAEKDYIRAAGMTTYTAMWKPNASEVWGEPLIEDGKFWQSLPVRKMLVTAGQWECFHDDIVEMAARLGAKPFDKGGDVELSVGKREVHVQCGIDRAVAVAPASTTLDIMAWSRRL